MSKSSSPFDLILGPVGIVLIFSLFTGSDDDKKPESSAIAEIDTISYSDEGRYTFPASEGDVVDSIHILYYPSEEGIQDSVKTWVSYESGVELQEDSSYVMVYYVHKEWGDSISVGMYTWNEETQSPGVLIEEKKIKRPKIDQGYMYPYKYWMKVPTRDHWPAREQYWEDRKIASTP
jgi:hypothetical protein